MLLADSSLWIQHLRRDEPSFADSLAAGLVLMHPFIAGELACGNLKNRAAFLRSCREMNQATVASDAETRRLIEDRHLWGRGLGWVDVHLLASAMLSHCRLWTLDRKLREAADELHIPR